MHSQISQLFILNITWGHQNIRHASIQLEELARLWGRDNYQFKHPKQPEWVWLRASLRDHPHTCNSIRSKVWNSWPTKTFFFFSWWKTRHASHSLNPRSKSFKIQFYWKFQSCLYPCKQDTHIVCTLNFPPQTRSCLSTISETKIPHTGYIKIREVYKMYTWSNEKSSIKCSIEVSQSTTQIRKFQKLMAHDLLFYKSIEAILHSQNFLYFIT